MNGLRTRLALMGVDNKFIANEMKRYYQNLHTSEAKADFLLHVRDHWTDPLRRETLKACGAPVSYLEAA